MFRHCKKYILYAVLIFPALSIMKAQGDRKIASYVNPFIGTGAVQSSLSGNNFPGATVPFGMIQLSPDTRQSPDWAQASGYDYNDDTIFGFSHTRLSGTGAADFFDILLMPTTRNADLNIDNFKSKFSHKDESARPGYYQVRLTDDNINAELTATTRVGFHRYTFPKGQKGHVFVDLDHSRDKGSWGTRVINAQIRVVDEYTIEGFRLITGWARLRKVYFHMKFSKPIAGNTLSEGNLSYENNKLINGTNVRALFNFDVSDGQPVLVKVGLSTVSTANAKQNQEEEIKDWNFDRVVAQASENWENELGKIKIEGTDYQKEIFYTALYHAYIQPNTISDINGEYTDIDYTTKRLKKGETQYSTFSLWDTYRAAHPLYTLFQTERTTDFVNSLLRQYDAYGYLPIWQLWGQENYCMIGNHSIPVIADALFKEIPNINKEKAYQAVRNSSLIPHLNSPFHVWEKYGYMPENIQTQSVSITLEMAYDDWCAAQMTKVFGNEEDYKRFNKRSQHYKNLYNEKSSFFQSKDDKGNWIEPFDPYKYGANGGYPFTEGNAWQYFWYVPHDMHNLVKMVGGDKTFSKKLDDFFTIDHQSGELNDNASGFIGQYAHGNEPSHHVAYLYNYVGQPSKTQYYVSKIMNELYNNSSSGYAGNDDCGEMSAWYVFSALGFYPVNPANGVYVIGSPLVQNAELKLPAGKKFIIKTDKKTDADIYIQSVTLNGKKYDNTYLKHSDIVNGGIVEFKMGSKPSKWGTKPDNKPLEWGF